MDMKYWLRIDHAPLLREPAPSPVACAAELLSAGECMALRWSREQGSTVCHWGFETSRARAHGELLLSEGGYLFGQASPPPTPAVSLCLRRCAELRTLSLSGTPARVALPASVLTGGPGSEALFSLLDRLGDGCGLLFLFRRSPGLDPRTAAQLPRLSPGENPVISALACEPRLYELVGCAFGGPAASLVADAACVTFPGLTTEAIPPTPVGQALFDAVPCTGVPAHLRPLCLTFSPGELSALTDLTRSAGRYGLAINKDTLPGPLFPLRSRGDLVLGVSERGERITMPRDGLTKGLFLGGAPGSGKGNLLFSLAFQLAQAGVPFLLIESAKEELHHLRKVLPDLNTWRPVDGGYVLDPFSLPPGVTVKEYRPALLQMLRVAFRLDGPLEELFSDALNRCFSLNGYRDDSTSASPGVTPFGMNEFIQVYNTLLLSRGYSEKTRSDMRTAGVVRLNSLYNQSRAVFDTITSIPVSQFASGQNLLELAPLTTIESKQLFATMFLISLGTWMRLQLKHSGGKLKLVILMDEAHNLLCDAQRTTGESYSFPADFAGLMLELRSVGVGFVIADQSAENIPPILFQVCDSKVFMGSNRFSGVAEHGEELGLDELALSHLHLLGPGEGLYQTSSLERALFFRSENLIDRFHLETPCARENRYLREHPRLTVETFRECAVCPARGSCTLAQKAQGRALSDRLLAVWQGPLRRCLAMPHGTEEERALRSKRSAALLGALFQESSQLHGSCDAAWSCGLVQFVRAYNRESEQKLDLSNLLNYAETWKGGKKHV